MRKKYLIGIDTETANGLIDKNGKLDLSQSLVYDVGWTIIDKKGKVFLERSFVVAEIFLDKELMKSAYFAEKIPQYWEDIKTGKRVLKSFKNIRMTFLADRKKYKCAAVFAHNAFFDYNALNNTLRFLSGSKYRFFFPYSLEIWDTLKMSRDVFGNKKGVEFLIGGVGLHLRNKEQRLLECKCTAPCKILFRVLYIQMPVFLHLGQSVIKSVSDVRGREFDQA